LVALCPAHDSLPLEVLEAIAALECHRVGLLAGPRSAREIADAFEYSVAGVYASEAPEDDDEWRHTARMLHYRQEHSHLAQELAIVRQVAKGLLERHGYPTSKHNLRYLSCFLMLERSRFTRDLVGGWSLDHLHASHPNVAPRMLGRRIPTCVPASVTVFNPSCEVVQERIVTPSHLPRFTEVTRFELDLALQAAKEQQTIPVTPHCYALPLNSLRSISNPIADPDTDQVATIHGLFRPRPPTKNERIMVVCSIEVLSLRA
jgi:hypothetical protein